MPLEKSKSKGAFGRNFKELVASGRPKKQALAIAYDMQRRSKKKKKRNNA